jgi:hypothetical protein
MNNLRLEIGFGDYDRTRVMVDGSVKIDGVDEDLALLGNDWWPYGLAANRKAVDAFLRYPGRYLPSYPPTMRAGTSLRLFSACR